MVKKFFCVFFILHLFFLSGCQYDKKDINKKNITPKGNLILKSMKSQNGDCYLIKEDNCNIVINCSQKENIKDTVEFLKNQNAQKIDYLILTDFSKDNLNGASVILRKLDVKNIVEPSYIPKNSEIYKTYKETLKFKNITPLSVKNDETISIGNITLDFFGCDNSYYKNDPQNCSLVFKITHFENCFLFLGNIKEERLSHITENTEKNIRADFIKIPGKTKYNKTLKTFIKKSNPSYCYITCSKNAPANYVTRNFLRKKNMELYLSFENDYTFVSNGVSLTLKKGIN